MVGLAHKDIVSRLKTDVIIFSEFLLILQKSSLLRFSASAHLDLGMTLTTPTAGANFRLASLPQVMNSDPCGSRYRRLQMASQKPTPKQSLSAPWEGKELSSAVFSAER